LFIFEPENDIQTLNKELVNLFINQALAEDVGDGDHTSLATIPAGVTGKARLLVKDTGILAGIELATEIFSIVDAALKVDLFLEDGASIKPADVAFEVTGSVHSILKAERLVLNCMQRMSGIATRTYNLTRQLAGTKARILDTRKTTPGFRYFEKWAVAIGGGVNHRFGLYDTILIKDNHVDYSGGIQQAIQNTRRYLQTTGKELPVVIEVRNLDELAQVLQAGGVNRILLDNFKPADMQQAVNLIAGRFATEASGGITEQNLLKYAATGVDYISIGALTHSVKSLDLSLKAVKL